VVECSADYRGRRRRAGRGRVSDHDTALKENGYAASTIRIEQDQPVVSSGPYAIVRHPMYAGGLVMMLATPIALGSVWGLVFAVLTVGALVWRLLDEEEFLSANLPGYAGYRRTMRYRLVPYLW
jgi:protein-S-isoprenylcysteine O-methyltransferase Ste14